MKEDIPSALEGERIDRVISLLTGASRSRVTELLENKEVTVNGVEITTKSHRLAEGDSLEFPDIQPDPEDSVTPDPAIQVTTIYEDEDVVVVDKPAGMVVHPGSGNRSKTLVNGLLAKYPEIAEVGESSRPGIVHRLDSGTSGLLVVARSASAYGSLVEQLKMHSVKRSYLALVLGMINSDRGEIDAPVGRSNRDRTRMAISVAGKESRTRYEVRQRFYEPLECCLLECELETGRTHQIRVHAAAIGHSVAGDNRYGGANTELPLSRPFLHAARLTFVHPSTGEQMDFHSELPDELTAVLAVLR